MVYVRALNTVGAAWTRCHSDLRQAARAQHAAAPGRVRQRWAVPLTVQPRPAFRDWRHQWAHARAQA
eukprot:6092228-Lingulodinium_polyedra.AAC.1